MTVHSRGDAMRRPRARGDDGSTIPLILGFFLLAFLIVAGSITLGQAFVQQRDLQDVCDGAAAAAAASSADLDRGASVASGQSLQFTAVQPVVDAYIARDTDRRRVHVDIDLSDDHQRIILRCSETSELTLGGMFARAHVQHKATSSSRAAVVG